VSDETAAPDVEGMQIDIAEAIGKATASIAIQGALVATLIRKDVITLGEAAEINAIALEGLEKVFRLGPMPDEMAKSAIRGFAASLAQHLTRH
jgi:hypothetical protein